jgi:hypothetical protein
MKQILLLFILLPVFLSATAQYRFVNLSLRLNTPVDSQEYLMNDTVYLDAVVKNYGPDTLRVTDSLAFMAINSQGQLEAIITDPNSLYLIYSKFLAPGDSAYFSKPFYKVTPLFTCIRVMPFMDSVKSIWLLNANIQDTLQGNNDKCYTLEIVPGTSVATLKENAASVRVYPNPAHNEMQLKVILPVKGNVSLLVTDLAGKVVLREEKQAVPAGDHTFSFNIANLNSGMYLYQVSAGGEKSTGKLLIE